MEKVMVISRKNLFKGSDPPSGFLSTNDEYLKLIYENFFWEERKAADSSTINKQPITYTAIVNPRIKKIFVYQRTSKKAESLKNNWSLGVTGHVDKDRDGNANDPIVSSFQEELREEVGIETSQGLTIIGYANEETGRNKFHFGILNLFLTEKEELSPVDTMMKKGWMANFQEANSIFYSPTNLVEDWTKIFFPILEKKFS